MSVDQLVLKVLDANANRVREGVRTAEDFARFIVGDLQQAERLKLIRQTLTEILRMPDGSSNKKLDESLVSSRNVSGDPMQPGHWKDVLRRIDKETPVQVAQRGLKRAQEGLRVLEENLRGVDVERADKVSRLRYTAYECEQWLVCASPAMLILQSAKVYVLLTSKLCKNGDAVSAAKALLKGGIKLIQLREKEMNDACYLALARQIQPLCAQAGAVFFCNDRVDLALLSGSNGVHLGQDDISMPDCRKLSGHKLLVGRSTHSVEQAKTAVGIDQSDYIGIGAMFETRTKSNTVAAGLKLAEDVSALKLNVPVFAIGGVTLDNLRSLKSTGVKRIAVSQAILGAEDTETAAKRFVDAMENS